MYLETTHTDKVVGLYEIFVQVSDTLIGSWMYFPCCLLQYYQNFMKNQEGKIELQKKVHKAKMICRFKLNMFLSFLIKSPAFSPAF